MTNDTIIIEETHGQLPETARQIRTAVFVDEQGFQEEFDTIDHIAYHVVLSQGATPLGTGRVFQDHGTWHIGRLAVHRAYRKKHLGAQMLTALEKIAWREGAECVVLNAQVRAQEFYRKQGYTAYGDTFLDENCPHIAMKKLAPID